jgi:glycosyltransferase involved in cell wall biosynthesis
MSDLCPSSSGGGPAPSVSVVICTYNRSALVRRALDACLRQSWPDLEVVVVDDGSVDDTRAVVAAVPDGRVRLSSIRNGGLSNARNVGIAAARGHYVVFLDDDDLPDEDWLQVLVDAVDDEHPIACCALRHVSPEGEAIRIESPRRLGPAFVGATALFRAGSFLIERRLLIDAGNFDVRARCSEHTELSFRILERLDDPDRRIAVIPRPLVTVERRPPGERKENEDPRIKLETATFMLQRHAAHFARQPQLAAIYWSIAGVAAARLRELPTARRCFAHSVRLHPTPRSLVRLTAACLAPVGGRLWGSRAPRTQVVVPG